MTGVPTLQVLLDDGTGAFPYDVSTYCRLPDSVAWNRGRSDEHSANQPGQLNLGFDNVNAEFTLGRVNLQPNASLESAFSAGGGTYGGGVRWAFDATTFLSGTRSIKDTTQVGDNSILGVQMERVPVVVGQTYTFGIWLKRDVGGSALIRLDAEWLDGANAHLGQTSFVDLNTTKAPPGVWTLVTVTGVAPASAASGRTRIAYTSGQVVGDNFWVDLAQAVVGTGPTFGAVNDQLLRIRETFPATPNVNLVPAASADFEDGSVGGWTGGGSVAPTLSNSAVRAKFGTKSLLVTWGTGGVFPQAASPAITGLVVGQTYVASIYVYVPAGNPGVTLSFGGTAGGSTGTAVDQWVRLTAVKTATATSHQLQLVANSSPTAGQTCFLDAAMVNVGTVAGEFNTLTQTTVNRWTGAVQDWPVTWPTGDDTLAVARITAVDALAALSRDTLESASHEEIMLDAPTAYYPMQGSSGDLSTSDVSGNNRPPLHVAFSATQILPTFGTDMQMPDGSTGAAWKGSGSKIARPLFTTNSSPLASSAISVTFVFWTDAANGDLSQFDWDTSATPANSLNIDYSTVGVGTPQFSVQRGDFGGGGGGIALSRNLSDGLPHVITVQADATGCDVWIDGVKNTGFAFTGTTFKDDRIQGPCTVGSIMTNNVTVAFAHHSYHMARLSDARVAAYHAALMTDFAGETPAQRIARVFTYVTGGYATGTLDAAGDTVLGPALQAARSPLDVVQEAGDADFGDVYVDGSGKLSTVAGATIAGQVTPVSLDAGWLGQETAFTGDMFGVVNDAKGQGNFANAQQFHLIDSASKAAHGAYPGEFTWSVNTDQQALDRLNWVIAQYADPQPRLASVTLDLLTMDPTNVAAALSLDLADLVQFTNLPAQTPGGTTLAFVVEGITDTTTVTADDAVRTLTLTLSAKALRSAWVLGDPTYGVLDSTTRLYI